MQLPIGSCRCIHWRLF